MLKRGAKILITPQEAVTLTDKYGTLKEWHYTQEVYEEWKKILAEDDIPAPEFRFFELLSACFNAGRICGIREQRAKQK